MTIVDSETLPPLHKDEDGVFVSDFIIKGEFVELYAEGIHPVTIYLSPTELIVVKGHAGNSNLPVVVRRHALREVATSAELRVLNGIRVEDTRRTMLRYVYQLQGEGTTVREWLEAIGKCRSSMKQDRIPLEDPFFNGAMGLGRSSPTHEFSSSVRERCVEGSAAPSSVERGPPFNGYVPVIAGNYRTLPRAKRRLLSVGSAGYCTLPRNVEKQKWGEGESAADVEEQGDESRPASESPVPPPLDLGSPLRHHTIRKGHLHSRSISSHGTACATTSPPTFLLPSRPFFKSKSMPRGVKKVFARTPPDAVGTPPKSPVVRMMHTVHRYLSFTGSLKTSQLDELTERGKPMCDSPQRRRLHQYRAKDVAEQLTEMDAKLLANIKPRELEDEAWTSKQKNERAPNVMAMVKSFNQLALLVPTEILEETTPQGRAKVISKYIKIASECCRLHNYNSLKSILAGLQCTPIFRLTKTWKEVPGKRKRRYKQLCALMSEENNWQLYREKLDNDIANDTPCIPFLGLFLTQIIQHGSYKVLRRARELNKSSSFSSYSVYRTQRSESGRNKRSSLVSSRSVPSSPLPQARKNTLGGQFQLNSDAVTSDSSESAEDILAIKKPERSNGSVDKMTPLSSNSWSLFSPDETDFSDRGFVSQEPKSDAETTQSLDLDDIRLSPKEDSPCVELPKSPTMESVVSGGPNVASKSAESQCCTMTEDSLTGSNAFGSRPSLDSVFGNEELRHEDIRCDIRSENSDCDSVGCSHRLVEHNRCSTPILATPKTEARSSRARNQRDSVESTTSVSEVQTPSDPPRLLERYKASASKCCVALNCNQELQMLLLEGVGSCNSEKRNYQLSLEREPVHL